MQRVLPKSKILRYEIRDNGQRHCNHTQAQSKRLRIDG